MHASTYGHLLVEIKQAVPAVNGGAPTLKIAESTPYDVGLDVKLVPTLGLTVEPLGQLATSPLASVLIRRTLLPRAPMLEVDPVRR
jgi:hypothetical protein